jgi:imidazolonepropionase-like amidohydrolase
MLPFTPSSVALLAALFAGLPATGTAAGPADSAGPAAVTLLRAQRIHVSPEGPPIDDGVVLMRGGRIVAAGPRATVSVPPEARDLGCAGGTVTAGFQNSHVHFNGPPYGRAAQQDRAALEAGMASMLTRHGFTTVVDTASDLRDTAWLRERTARGELRGPRILTTGTGIFPPDGLPFYLAGLPAAVRQQMPQPATPEAAQAAVQANLQRGADAIKLFVATPQADRSVRHMPAAVARAAADETHGRGKLVMAHPTDVAGLRSALDAGVDVIVHTTLGVMESWPAPLVAQLVERKTALVPTLKLWHFELDKGGVPPAVQQRLVSATQQQLKQYADAGGQILFGTDVGYMTDHDPADEYRLMAGAGLTPAQILASLTTAPAARWNEQARRGRVAAGQDADLVVLGGDPLAAARHFADVRCTIRGGEVLYAK